MAVTVGPKLSGEQKAAILLISLGPDISSEVFKDQVFSDQVFKDLSL